MPGGPVRQERFDSSSTSRSGWLHAIVDDAVDQVFAAAKLAAPQQPPSWRSSTGQLAGAVSGPIDAGPSSQSSGGAPRQAGPRREYTALPFGASSTAQPPAPPPAPATPQAQVQSRQALDGGSRSRTATQQQQQQGYGSARALQDSARSYLPAPFPNPLLVQTRRLSGTSSAHLSEGPTSDNPLMSARSTGGAAAGGTGTLRAATDPPPPAQGAQRADALPRAGNTAADRGAAERSAAVAGGAGRRSQGGDSSFADALLPVHTPAPAPNGAAPAPVSLEQLHSYTNVKSFGSGGFSLGVFVQNLVLLLRLPPGRPTARALLILNLLFAGAGIALTLFLWTVSWDTLGKARDPNRGRLRGLWCGEAVRLLNFVVALCAVCVSITSSALASFVME